MQAILPQQKHCAGGKYANSLAAEACTTCPSGFVAIGPGGKAECDACSDGQYRDQNMDATFCVDCPAGMFDNLMSEGCDDCPAGFFQDELDFQIARNAHRVDSQIQQQSYSV